jgi:para-nitrobenzyl esterase
MLATPLSQSRFRTTSFVAACAYLLMLSGAVACGKDKSSSSTKEADGSVTTGGGTGGSSAKDGGTLAVSGLHLKLKDGELEGDMVGDARRFLKIPFAKPPTGELRWKAPVRNDPWKGVRHETDFVAGCPQLADQGAPASSNEDCLYLNVWSPEPAPDHAPVMVWIHGGGNFSGGTGIPVPTTMNTLWYDGQFFASKQGVVLVTIQYRLGPLGFFAHPSLGDESGPMGNQGLLDQRMALQWVQDNIAKFGGDPKNVTIFGESAGSADVCYHVASPGSRGLFHRAISESGGCTFGSVGAERTPDVVGPTMVAYGKALGCAEGKDQLACMRKVSVDDLLANSMQPMPGAGGSLAGGMWSFAAVIDGAKGFFPDAPRALFDRGEIAKVPYLLGSNNDEGTTFVIRATALTSADDYMADLKMRFGDKAGDVAAVYPPSDFGGDFNAARARVIGDSGVACSTHDTARRASKAGLKVFMYNFHMDWSIAASLLHAGHASEISHVFGAPYLPMPDPDSEMVGAAMNAYWARFAKAGDPNGKDAPATWPEFTQDADKRLELDPKWQVLDNFRTKECAFWRKYYGLE